MKHLRHKYRAQPTEANGRRYASKKEAHYAAMLPKREDVITWLEQVPIRLPGNTKYVVDFLEFHADGTVHFIDVKGMQTETFRLKKRQVEALYPFSIEVV